MPLFLTLLLELPQPAYEALSWVWSFDQDQYVEHLRHQPLVQVFLDKHKMYPWKSNIWFMTNGDQTIDLGVTPIEVQCTWGTIVNPKNGQWLADNRVRWCKTRSNHSFYLDQLNHETNVITTIDITNIQFFQAVNSALAIK